MTTAGDMIDEIIGIFEAGESDTEILVTTNSMTSGSNSFTVDSVPVGVRPGIHVEIDSELMRVTSVNGTTVYVKREARGTQLAEHGTGSIVRIQPRHPRGLLLMRMAEEIQSWDQRLYRVQMHDVTVSPLADTRAFDIPSITSDTVVYRELGVWRKNPDNARYERERGWRLLRNVDTGDFPSGYALQLSRTYRRFTEYRVGLGVNFDVSALTESVDLNTGLGLQLSMNEIVRYGTMARSHAGLENRRIRRTSQGQSQDPRGVPVGSALQSSATWRRMADEAYAREATKLLAQYPLSTN